MDLAPLRVAVIGGGIGGLAAALALTKVGARPKLYERAPRFGEVGQGLGVFANAVRALDWLGVGACVRARGQAMHEASTFDRNGKLLMRTDPLAHERRTAMPSLLMTRPELHGCLLEALPPQSLLTGAELTSIEPGAGGISLGFKDRDDQVADLVIGADGWQSTVRRALWGHEPMRYSGLVCWRGMAINVRLRHPNLLPVIEGPGAQFGIGPLGSHRCYWFASFPAPAESGPHQPAAAKAMLLQMFRGYAFEIEDVIKATPAEGMMRTDLYDRPGMDSWVRGRVALLGDAAHPMVPTLGQGAATAIEDGVVLARRLQMAETMEAGLAAYERERIPRANSIAATAHKLARLATWTNPIAIAIRNLSYRLTPSAALSWIVERQIGYDAASV